MNLLWQQTLHQFSSDSLLCRGPNTSVPEGCWEQVGDFVKRSGFSPQPSLMKKDIYLFAFFFDVARDAGLIGEICYLYHLLKNCYRTRISSFYFFLFIHVYLDWYQLATRYADPLGLTTRGTWVNTAIRGFIWTILCTFIALIFHVGYLE